MAQTVLITLTTAGADTGPFNLYTNIDGYAVPFETGVTKIDLEAGYVSMLVPDTAYIIRVQSDNSICDNYVDLTLTTTTTTSTSTTSTTTTAAPLEIAAVLFNTDATCEGDNESPSTGVIYLLSNSPWLIPQFGVGNLVLDNICPLPPAGIEQALITLGSYPGYTIASNSVSAGAPNYSDGTYLITVDSLYDSAGPNILLTIVGDTATYTVCECPATTTTTSTSTTMFIPE